MLCKFLSFFAIATNNCLPTYLELILILFFKSPNKLSTGSWLGD